MLCYSTGSLPDGFTLPRIAEALSGTPFTGVELVLTAAMLEIGAEYPVVGGVLPDATAIQAQFDRFRDVRPGALTRSSDLLPDGPLPWSCPCCPENVHRDATQREPS